MIFGSVVFHFQESQYSQEPERKTLIIRNDQLNICREFLFISIVQREFKFTKSPWGAVNFRQLSYSKE